MLPLFVPYAINDRVIDKEIIYSDKKPVFNELYHENSLVVNIDKLEECIILIVKTNPEIKFKAIRYSIDNKKVYFYADKMINTNSWTNEKLRTYQHLKDSKEILLEIKKIINFNIDEFIENQNTMIAIDKENTISLTSIRRLIIKKNKLENMIKTKYEKILEKKLEKHFGKNNTIIYGFDHKKNELSIGFCYMGDHNDYKKIVFSKKNDDLYIKQSDTYYAEDIFFEAADELKKIFNRYEEFTDFFASDCVYVPIINSNLHATIDPRYGIIIKNSDCLFPDFKIMAFTTYIKAKCNSGNTLALINSSKREILENSYVYINECPKNMQDELINMRKKELFEEENRKKLEEEKRLEQKRLEEEKRLEQQKLEEEKIEEEQHKEDKRLKLKRKLFPFFKNDIFNT